MPQRSLWFVAPKQTEIRESSTELVIGEDEIEVETIVSAVSPGTELKVYRGEFSTNEEGQSNSAFSDSFSYPCQFGYSVVGKLVKKGSKVNDVEIGQLVFAFHPHEERFVIKRSDVRVVPEGIPAEDAVFLPNVETSINFAHDAKAMVGERIAIFGQGIVGLLTTYLMSQVPFSEVYAFDLFPKRREMSKMMGATSVLDPSKVDVSKAIPNGADVTFEVSGSSRALGQAVQATGYNGRLIVGSWYGNLPINLSNSFHRSHITMIASQVSSIRPELSGRWDKCRRFNVAWDVIRKLKPSQLVTHRISFQNAGEGYRLLDEQPAEAVQVVFTYEK
eukprot:TRINITY_DN9990_c0_g1_i1.p1 TRINITY_DN9990_c0_g1~~TRINITY_DN9990_c0_g1_i1.p1  ORF type:complete len:333 (-),score=79.74 TRINITY_DN9990_c0_g1_i1:83-1081(-)